MSLKVDLHAHSTASDGTLAPAALVRAAQAAGVDVLALTDHDTLDGLEEAASSASALGVGFVPGVEVSVTWKGATVHVLGLGVDRRNPALCAGLDELCRFREWRADEIGRGLHAAGIAGATAGARALARGRLVSRTHFARYLVDKGVCPDLRSVFRKYLVHGKPGYVAGRWASLVDAVGWIRSAGGHAVIAHPARYAMTRTKLRRLVSEFVDAGGEGLEVVSGSHSRDDAFGIAMLVREFGLLASAGSDYHGPEQPWIDLGKVPALPAGCKAIWEERVLGS